ncbi:MAG: hypothetical protein IJ702_09155, partial [Fretibacterium sp.]|nr:hypothetical protein [Fretibacterium sp.]
MDERTAGGKKQDLDDAAEPQGTRRRARAPRRASLSPESDITLTTVTHAARRRRRGPDGTVAHLEMESVVSETNPAVEAEFVGREGWGVAAREQEPAVEAEFVETPTISFRVGEHTSHEPEAASEPITTDVLRDSAVEVEPKLAEEEPVTEAEASSVDEAERALEEAQAEGSEPEADEPIVEAFEPELAEEEPVAETEASSVDEAERAPEESQ